MKIERAFPIILEKQFDKLWTCIYCIGNAYFEMGKYQDGTEENKKARERLKTYQAELGRLENEKEEDIKKLKILCKELLDGANKCNQKPYYIVQPFLGIVKRHSKIIEKYKLLD